uniref:Uncharacterized protein n=1 Tax=Syphacia muris TaxID=451379 RepID=A0A0N5AQY8_9BILA
MCYCWHTSEDDSGDLKEFEHRKTKSKAVQQGER